MSKKLAEGIDGLVLDVKVGARRVHEDPGARRGALAGALIGIGRGAGKRVTALLTAMDQPLGRAVGNALEVAESIELLRGGGPADLRELTVALGAEMLVLARLAPDLAEARRGVEAAIDDGRGLAKLRADRRGPGRRPARWSTTRPAAAARPRWRERGGAGGGRRRGHRRRGARPGRHGAGRGPGPHRGPHRPRGRPQAPQEGGRPGGAGRAALRRPPQPRRRAGRRASSRGCWRAFTHRPGPAAPPPLILERMAEP